LSRRDILALQRAIGNRSVNHLLQRDGPATVAAPARAPSERQADSGGLRLPASLIAAARSRPVPLTPPEMADRAANEGLASVKDAAITAGAAFLVESIEGTKHLGTMWGASKRDSVVKARKEAARLALILAYAAARELNEGTGLYGAAAPGEDERAVTRQRAQVKGKGVEAATRELQGQFEHGALLEGAKLVLTGEQESWLAPELQAGRKQLVDPATAAIARGGTPAVQTAAAAKAVAAALPAVTKQVAGAAVEALDGSKHKALREKFQDQTAGEAAKVLNDAIKAESGPGAKKSELTKKGVDGTFVADNVSFGLRRLGDIIDLLVSKNGDNVGVSALLKIPVGHGAFVGLKVTGLARREADATSTNVTFSFAAGWEIPSVVQALGEVGGYMSTQSDRGGGGCMEMSSYVLYRRCRESSVIPRELTNRLWGLGGITAKKGESEDDAKYKEAEGWAGQVEGSMTERDMAETGLHLAGSGTVGGHIGSASAGVVIDTGTRYTKKGIDEARKQGKGQSVLGQRGAQEGIGFGVTTLQILGSAQAKVGPGASAALKATWEDRSGKCLTCDVRGSLGFQVPSSDAEMFATWAGDAIGTVGKSILHAIDNFSNDKAAKEKAKTAGKDILGLGWRAVRFPIAQTKIIDALSPVKSGVKSGLSTAETHVKGALGMGGGAAHSGGSSALSSLSTASSGGYQIYGVIDFKDPKKRYIALQTTSATNIDSPVLELSYTKASSILLYDFEKDAVELGGAPLSGSAH
jgi:hypothetical protein